MRQGTVILSIGVCIVTSISCTQGDGNRCAPEPPSVAACGNTSLPLTHSAITTNSGSSPNVLTLAAPSAKLLSPWDARDFDLLRIAAARTPGSDIVTGAIVEVTTPCSGGGSMTDTQNNVPPPWYSEGDSYTTTYDACVSGSTQTDGSQSYSVDVLIGQPYVDSTWSSGTTIARNLTRTNLTTGEVSYAIGSMSEQLAVEDNTQYTQVSSGESQRNWFNNGQEQLGTETYHVTYSWDETLQTFQWDFDVSSTNMAFGDSSAVTTQTLTGTLGQPPEAGQFKSIKIQSGVSYVSTITATGGGNVLVETDIDGDGIADTTMETTWNLLLLDSPLNQYI